MTTKVQTRQAEIREGMVTILKGMFAGIEDDPELLQDCYDKVNQMRQFQASKGCVLKVKCPDCAWSQFQDGESVGMTPCFTCNSTGYVKEPIIEEG